MPQAAPLVATEAAVASTMTAAEIAAAEAAAAHAAQVAAAQTLAAEQAAALAAQQATAATTAAAEQAANSGIQTLAQEVAGKPLTGIETLNMGQVPVTGPAPGMSEAQYQFLHNSTASTDPSAVGEIIKSFPPAAPSMIPPITPPAPPPIPNVPGLSPEALPGLPPEISNLATNAQRMVDTAPVIEQTAGEGIKTSMLNNPLYTSPSPVTTTPPVNYELSYNSGVTQGLTRPPLNEAATFNLTGSGAQPAAKPGMFEEFTNMSLPNKLLTGMMGATGYEMLNRPKPKEEEEYKSTFKPGLYTGYTPVQPTPYQPRYAVGGIADLGGYSDYARGGRLLKGPGDGMSDDIPATIANKQPARLANEEFVVPADVVSHLGNGSSEAGAKVLYKMMERVRKARTGNKKQGKQINPDKYLA